MHVLNRPGRYLRLDENKEASTEEMIENIVSVSLKNINCSIQTISIFNIQMFYIIRALSEHS